MDAGNEVREAKRVTHEWQSSNTTGRGKVGWKEIEPNADDGDSDLKQFEPDNGGQNASHELSMIGLVSHIYRTSR